MVYRGGLENRFGFTANGGSNPSPSANFMKEYLSLIIWTVVVTAAFGIAWRMGYLQRLSTYIADTREELRKCTWPTQDELKGSTVLVLVAIVLTGGFTVVVDVAIAAVVHWII